MQNEPASQKQGPPPDAEDASRRQDDDTPAERIERAVMNETEVDMKRYYQLFPCERPLGRR